MTLAIAELNNQYLNLLGLIDGATEFLADGSVNPAPTYINNASGTVKIYDDSNTLQVIAPSGGTSSALAYIAASSGNYRALITSDFVSRPGASYTAFVDVTAPGGFVGHWEIPVIAKARTQ